MGHVRRDADDAATILEPLEALVATYGGPPPGPHLPPPAEEPRGRRDAGSPSSPSGPGAGDGVVEEQPFRPTLRPPTPRLLLLDDGVAAEGELVRLRDQVTIIGRSDGQIRLPHDPLVSGRHAEIVRDGTPTAPRWILRDLASANGTFVRCIATVLRPDRLVLIGSRRFRFETPGAGSPGADADTRLATAAEWPADLWPVLVEASDSAAPIRLRLHGPQLLLGRPGFGNQLELDDPLLAGRHARISYDATGAWRLEALPSKNGIWAQIGAIRLATMGRFQCGEQRFLFMI